MLQSAAFGGDLGKWDAIKSKTDIAKSEQVANCEQAIEDYVSLDWIQLADAG